MADLPGQSLPNLNVTPATPPDITGAYGNILNLQKMMSLTSIAKNQAVSEQQDFNDQQAIRQSLVDNTHSDPVTGQPVIDHGGMLKDLTQNPSALMKFNAMQADMQIKQQQAMKDQLANIQTSNAIKANIAQATLYGMQNGDPQTALDRGHQQAQDAGLDTTAFPTTYDTSVVGKLQQVANAGTPVHDQIQQQMDKQRLNQENQQNLRTGSAALSNEYAADKTTTEFNQVGLAATQVQTAYQQYSKALQQGKDTGPAVAAMIVGMGKSENPNISPRLSTIEQLQHARGWSDDAQALLDKISAGGDIAPGQAKAIADFMSKRMEDLRGKQALTDAKFQGMAVGRGVPPVSAGLDPDHILSNPDVTPNPFFANPVDNGAQSTNTPAIQNTEPAAPAQAATPQPVAHGKWISEAKFNALPPAVQTKIKADGVEVR